MRPSAGRFFEFANHADGTQTELSFECKYYGSCPEIHSDAPPSLLDVLEIMASRKVDGAVVRCHLKFTEQGADVISRKSKVPIVEWQSKRMASCATTPLPKSKSRRLGLLKIRDIDTGELMWHLFKYYVHKIDNMTECFKFVVDCGLRDIGRSFTAQLAQHSVYLPDSQWDAPPAWPQPVPPTYAMAELAYRDLTTISSITA
jgi:hypothetical protein